MARRARWVSHLEQADLAEVDVREGVTDEWVEARLVDLDVEDRTASGRHDDGLDALLERLVMSGFTQARSKIVPTTWKFVSSVGPAATTQKRTVSPGSAVSGCVTY